MPNADWFTCNFRVLGEPFREFLWKFSRRFSDSFSQFVGRFSGRKCLNVKIKALTSASEARTENNCREFLTSGKEELKRNGKIWGTEEAHKSLMSGKEEQKRRKEKSTASQPLTSRQPANVNWKWDPKDKCGAFFAPFRLSKSRLCFSNCRIDNWLMNSLFGAFFPRILRTVWGHFHVYPRDLLKVVWKLFEGVRRALCVDSIIPRSKNESICWLTKVWSICLDVLWPNLINA